MHGRAVAPRSPLITPQDSQSLRTLLEEGIDFTESVIWLDELQQFLGPGGLTVSDLSAITRENPGCRLVGTVRTQVLEQLSPSDGTEPPEWSVVRQAELIWARPMLTEVEKSEAIRLIPSISLAFLDSVGLAEYLSASPDLIKRYEAAQDNHPVAYFLIRAACGLAEAGVTTSDLGQVCSLAEAMAIVESVKFDTGLIDCELKWTEDAVYGTSALLTVESGKVKPSTTSLNILRYWRVAPAMSSGRMQ